MGDVAGDLNLHGAASVYDPPYGAKEIHEAEMLDAVNSLRDVLKEMGTEIGVLNRANARRWRAQMWGCALLVVLVCLALGVVHGEWELMSMATLMAVTHII